MKVNPYKEKSDEAWEDGMAFLRAGRVNAAANRLYYATFQALKGHFVVRGEIDIDEQSGVHSKIFKLICPGIEQNRKLNYRKKINELFTYRITADYKVESVRGDVLKNLADQVNAIRVEYLKPQDCLK